jgi:hypothetical protein
MSNNDTVIITCRKCHIEPIYFPGDLDFETSNEFQMLVIFLYLNFNFERIRKYRYLCR